MNSNDPDDLDDPLLAWGLGERLGGEVPPDLVAGVQDRLQRRVRAYPPPRMSKQTLLAAALVLLGTLVVLGVALWPRAASSSVAAPSHDAQDPSRDAQDGGPAGLSPVGSVADAEALPLDTRAVEAIGVDDAVIAALTRLRDLEVLVVREPWNESSGLAPQVTPPEHARHITNASWRHFGSFTKLRRLALSGTACVGRVESGAAADVITALESLPRLEDLALRYLDTADAVLERLPSLRYLRRLDLSFNLGFAEDGLLALRRCRSLRALSLRGCQQLHGSWLATLHEVPELEELDLALIEGLNWRTGQSEPSDAEGTRLRNQARGWADSLSVGINNETLEGLARAPRLRVLDVSDGRWTNRGLGALGACHSLRELAMFSVPPLSQSDHECIAKLPKELVHFEVRADYTDAFCAAVREHLTNLRHLNVSNCSQLSDRGLADLLAMPSLRRLDMRQMGGLTVASMESLVAATQLETLDVRGNGFVEVQHVLRLKRTLPNLRRLVTSVPDAELAAAQAAQEPAHAQSRDEIFALPVDTQSLVAGRFADDGMEALVRLHALERFEIGGYLPRGKPNPLPVPSITDAGLRELAALPTLRVLRVTGQLGVRGPGLQVLGELPMLTELTLQQMRVPDEAIASLAKLAGLRVLRLQDCQGFGRAGIESIAQLPGLEELSLAGCVHVDEDWLALLASRRGLRVLDLSRIGSHTYFDTGFEGPLLPPAPGSGVTDKVLTALGKLTTLRELNLEQAGITGAGLQQLQRLPTLEALDLSGVPLRSADLRGLPASVVQLTLHGCRRLGPDLGQLLAAATPHLQTLDLLGCDTLTDECLPSLRGLVSLRRLDLSYCHRFTAAAVQALTAMTQVETLTLRRWTMFGDAEWTAVRKMPNLKQLDIGGGFETLR